MGYIGQAPTKVPLSSSDILDGSIAEADIANDAVNFVTHLKAGTDGELITWDASGNPAAVPVGTSTHVLTSGGTGVAPTFQAASGGDVRNFIIDGDMTQSPQGDITGQGNNTYGAVALIKHVISGGEIVVDTKRATDVPTVAESGHQSAYSMQCDVTTAESAVGAGDNLRHFYFMTGSDFAHLHKQEVTLSFWVKSTKTGIHCVAFQNSANNRNYIIEYTIDLSNTWERKTMTLTLDQSGTWLFTEADKGLMIIWTQFSGSTGQGSANTWQAGNLFATSNQVAGGDSTSNNFFLSQVGLYLGSTAPTFLGEPIATVADQVEYYVTQLDGDNLIISAGFAAGTTSVRTALLWMEKRKIPTITVGATMVQVHHGGGTSTTSTSVTVNDIGKTGCRFSPNVSSGLTLGQGVIIRINAVAGNRVLIDARH
jgi:hypothetical protein